MELSNLHRERKLSPQRFLVYGLISTIVHGLIFLALFLWMGRMPTAIFLAAGPGEGGDGGGGAIQVGMADASEILGFARRQKVAYEGDDPNDTVNNVRLQHKAEAEEVVEPLPNAKQKEDLQTRKTNLPVTEKKERLWTPKERRGSSGDNTASLGTTYGSQKPAIQGGIGIGEGGGGSGLGQGLPGGSEYGRRIQNILSRNFTPANLPVNGVSNVVIYVKIARDGRITSVVGGRVPKIFFKQSSPYEQLNYAAERAIIATATQGLPPFPVGFLSGVQEAIAEVWFQYP
ncbi:MAG: TonB C-terminal domain-containing protein [Acidobacteriota bacterium]